MIFFVFVAVVFLKIGFNFNLFTSLTCLTLDLLTVVNVGCGWHMFACKAMLQIRQYEIRFTNLFITNNNALDCIARPLLDLFCLLRHFYDRQKYIDINTHYT